MYLTPCTAQRRHHKPTQLPSHDPRACLDRERLTPSPMLFPGVTVTDNQGLLSRSYSIDPAEFSPVSAHPQRLTAPYPTLTHPWSFSSPR